MQTHHVSSHELALLERFVHDCVQQLPKLPTATPHQLPQRCSSYHTGCAAMLRQVLSVLAPLSPRMCQLVAQVWDLTSLNFFVLIQLAQSSIEEKDAVYAKWRQLQRFGEETTVQHAQRVAKYEAELEQVRLESRELRAELQKTRQKGNRLGVENAQLRKAVDGLMEMNDTLNSRMADGQSVVERLDDNVLDASERGIRSDAEEWELYGVSAEELERLDVVHPIESCAQDFDQLFEGLFDREREQMALVNEMDRFMNSNVVALLWRHGPDEDNTKFLEQMMSKRTIGSQTQDDELSVLSEDLYGDGDGDGDADNNNNKDSRSNDPSLVSGQTGKATVMTKRQLLPPPLRAQLTTRPKIQRVLEKDQLSQIVLLVLLEKMEVDGAMIRQHQPRVAFHRFMKEFFSSRYGLVPLAEYRMMEAVKSILYYHEKQEAEARRMRQITGAAPPSSTSAAPQQPQPLQQAAVHTGGWSFCLLPGLDTAQLSRDDLRISLFARLCELVPLQWSDAQVAPVAGNLFACAINALLDFLGDVIELDRSCGSLRELVSRFNGSSGRHQHWEVSMETASLLVTHHFAYCDATRVELLHNRLETLVMDAADGSGGREAATVVSSLSLLPVDSLLVFFATQWFENDQRLTARLHDAFHRQVLLQKERDAHDIHYESPPMETLRRVWQGLGDEHLSALDLHELERAFESILELRKTPTQTITSHSPLHGSRRVSAKRQSILGLPSLADSSGHGSRPSSASPAASAATMGLCIGGISEKEFVFQTQQVLRVRRVCRGLRTNGRCIVDARTQQHVGARGRVMTDERETVATVASYELKPGLTDAAADK